MHGVGERVVQCCEVLGGVITREYRRKLGGGGDRRFLWGEECRDGALTVQSLAAARHTPSMCCAEASLWDTRPKGMS